MQKLSRNVCRTRAKRSVDEYKEIDKYTSTRKIFYAIRSLTEEANGGVLFLTDTFEKKHIRDNLRQE